MTENESTSAQKKQNASSDIMTLKNNLFFFYLYFSVFGRISKCVVEIYKIKSKRGSFCAELKKNHVFGVSLAIRQQK